VQDEVDFVQTEDCSSTECVYRSKEPEDDSIPWVQCDSCDRWFHTACVGCDYNKVSLAAHQFHCGMCWGERRWGHHWTQSESCSACARSLSTTVFLCWAWMKMNTHCVCNTCVQLLPALDVFTARADRRIISLPNFFIRFYFFFQ